MTVVRIASDSQYIVKKAQCSLFLSVYSYMDDNADYPDVMIPFFP